MKELVHEKIDEAVSGAVGAKGMDIFFSALKISEETYPYEKGCITLGLLCIFLDGISRQNWREWLRENWIGRRTSYGVLRGVSKIWLTFKRPDGKMIRKSYFSLMRLYAN